MELPAYTIVIPCLTFMGRKPTVVGTYLLTALCSFVVAYTPLGLFQGYRTSTLIHFNLCHFIAEYETLRVAVSMSGKFFITTCFAVLYLLGAELFPTATRTTGLASAIIMGRLGSIGAPFVVDLVVGIKSSSFTLISYYQSILLFSFSFRKQRIGTCQT